MKRTLTRNILIATSLAGCLAVGTPTAQARVQLKISPKTPIVDDNVTASFVVKQPLKAGWHYEGLIVGATGFDCAGFVEKTSKRNPGKRKTMSFRFSPYDDNLNGGPEWCQGKAGITIRKIRNGDEKGNSAILVGDAEFRFVAKP